jgi:basic membrane lipoprotein Med (substrate-binding protein (PBP1-ABC) superfamily)
MVAAVVAACGSTSDTTTSAADTSAPATGATDTAAAAAPVKAAWIYVGPANDHGWSQAHDEGRKAVEAAMGDKVVTTFKESVPEPDVAPVIDQLIADGNKIIFATSFGYQDAMAAAAAAHPDVKFEMATGFKKSDNMAVYYGAGEDAIYLSGMAAGAATKNGTIGYIVPFPIPEVVRHTNAFALGAQATHPGAKIKIVWTKSWFDPKKETQAAESLIAAGADVLGQNVDSPAAGQVAEKKGIPWVGYDSDATEFAPTQWLTGAVYNWGPYYTKRVQAVADGTWTTGDYYGNIADGFTDIAPFGPGVDQATQDAIAKAKADIVAGTSYEFQGPLKDQDGKERVPAGSKLALGDILSMDWFVEGIEGSPKG